MSNSGAIQKAGLKARKNIAQGKRSAALGFGAKKEHRPEGVTQTS
jgi:hypothetical protein